MSGSCHLDRAFNVKIGVECQIFVNVIFLTVVEFCKATSPKGFSASKCDVVNWIFYIFNFFVSYFNFLYFDFLYLYFFNKELMILSRFCGNFVSMEEEFSVLRSASASSMHLKTQQI